MFHKDYLVRQIESMSESIACIVFNKEAAAKNEIRSEEKHTDTDLLYVLLCDLVAKNSINEAENLLFDMLDPYSYNQLAIAEDFYNRLDRLSDKELADANFSREEIANGLDDVKAIFSLPEGN